MTCGKLTHVESQKSQSYEYVFIHGYFFSGAGSALHSILFSVLQKDFCMLNTAFPLGTDVPEHFCDFLDSLMLLKLIDPCPGLALSFIFADMVLQTGHGSQLVQMRNADHLAVLANFP